jgi:YD repeat-containing protein
MNMILSKRTLPSGLFCTQPVTPYSVAFLWVKALLWSEGQLAIKQNESTYRKLTPTTVRYDQSSRIVRVHTLDGAVDFEFDLVDCY